MELIQHRITSRGDAADLSDDVSPVCSSVVVAAAVVSVAASAATLSRVCRAGATATSTVG